MTLAQVLISPEGTKQEYACFTCLPGAGSSKRRLSGFFRPKGGFPIFQITSSEAHGIVLGEVPGKFLLWVDSSIGDNMLRVSFRYQTAVRTVMLRTGSSTKRPKSSLASRGSAYRQAVPECVLQFPSSGKGHSCHVSGESVFTHSALKALVRDFLPLAGHLIRQVAHNRYFDESELRVTPGPPRGTQPCQAAAVSIYLYGSTALAFARYARPLPLKAEGADHDPSRRVMPSEVWCVDLDFCTRVLVVSAATPYSLGSRQEIDNFLDRMLLFSPTAEDLTASPFRSDSPPHAQATPEGRSSIVRAMTTPSTPEGRMSIVRSVSTPGIGMDLPHVDVLISRLVEGARYDEDTCAGYVESGALAAILRRLDLWDREDCAPRGPKDTKERERQEELISEALRRLVECYQPAMDFVVGSFLEMIPRKPTPQASEAGSEAQPRPRAMCVMARVFQKSDAAAMSFARHGGTEMLCQAYRVRHANVGIGANKSLRCMGDIPTSPRGESNVSYRVPPPSWPADSSRTVSTSRSVAGRTRSHHSVSTSGTPVQANANMSERIDRGEKNEGGGDRGEKSEGGTARAPNGEGLSFSGNAIKEPEADVETGRSEFLSSFRELEVSLQPSAKGNAPPSRYRTSSLRRHSGTEPSIPPAVSSPPPLPPLPPPPTSGKGAAVSPASSERLNPLADVTAAARWKVPPLNLPQQAPISSLTRSTRRSEQLHSDRTTRSTRSVGPAMDVSFMTIDVEGAYTDYSGERAPIEQFRELATKLGEACAAIDISAVVTLKRVLQWRSPAKGTRMSEVSVDALVPKLHATRPSRKFRMSELGGDALFRERIAMLHVLMVLTRSARLRSHLTSPVPDLLCDIVMSVRMQLAATNRDVALSAEAVNYGVFSVLYNYARHAELLHRVASRALCPPVSFDSIVSTARAVPSVKADSFLYRVRSRLRQIVYAAGSWYSQRHYVEEVFVLLEVIGTYMRECRTRVTSDAVVTYAIKELLEVRKCLFPRPFPIRGDTLGLVDVFHSFIQILCELLRPPSTHALQSLCVGLMLDCDDLYFLLREYLRQLLGTPVAFRCRGRRAQERLAQYRARVLLLFRRLVSSMVFVVPPSKGGGSGILATQDDAPSLLRSSDENETHQTRLARLMFLADPINGAVARFLSSSDVFEDAVLRVEALKLLESLYEIPDSPFQRAAFVDPAISFHFVSFVKLYTLELTDGEATARAATAVQQGILDPFSASTGAPMAVSHAPAQPTATPAFPVAKTDDPQGFASTMNTLPGARPQTNGVSGNGGGGSGPGARTSVLGHVAGAVDGAVMVATPAAGGNVSALETVATELCRMHLSVLMAFARNKNEEIIRKFYQLRVVDFLSQEIDLEFMLSLHNPSQAADLAGFPLKNPKVRTRPKRNSKKSSSHPSQATQSNPELGPPRPTETQSSATQPSHRSAPNVVGMPSDRIPNSTEPSKAAIGEHGGDGTLVADEGKRTSSGMAADGDGSGFVDENNSLDDCETDSSDSWAAPVVIEPRFKPPPKPANAPSLLTAVAKKSQAESDSQSKPAASGACEVAGVGSSGGMATVADVTGAKEGSSCQGEGNSKDVQKISDVSGCSAISGDKQILNCDDTSSLWDDMDDELSGLVVQPQFAPTQAPVNAPTLSFGGSGTCDSEGAPAAGIAGEETTGGGSSNTVAATPGQVLGVGGRENSTATNKDGRDKSNANDGISGSGSDRCSDDDIDDDDDLFCPIVIQPVIQPPPPPANAPSLAFAFNAEAASPTIATPAAPIPASLGNTGHSSPKERSPGIVATEEIPLKASPSLERSLTVPLSAPARPTSAGSTFSGTGKPRSESLEIVREGDEEGVLSGLTRAPCLNQWVPQEGNEGSDANANTDAGGRSLNNLSNLPHTDDSACNGNIGEGNSGSDGNDSSSTFSDDGVAIVPQFTTLPRPSNAPSLCFEGGGASDDGRPTQAHGAASVIGDAVTRPGDVHASCPVDGTCENKQANVDLGDCTAVEDESDGSGSVSPGLSDEGIVIEARFHPPRPPANAPTLSLGAAPTQPAYGTAVFEEQPPALLSQSRLSSGSRGSKSSRDGPRVGDVPVEVLRDVLSTNSPTDAHPAITDIVSVPNQLPSPTKPLLSTALDLGRHKASSSLKHSLPQGTILRTVGENKLAREVKKGESPFLLERRLDGTDPPSPELEPVETGIEGVAGALQKMVSKNRWRKSYEIQRSHRRLYKNRTLHAEVVLLLLSLLLTPGGALEPLYSDNLPVLVGKKNVLYLLYKHLSHGANTSIIPLLTSECVRRLGRPSFSLLKLLCPFVFPKFAFQNLARVNRGAYGAIYHCELPALCPVGSPPLAVKQVDMFKQHQFNLYRLFAEVRALDTLRHVNEACRLYDYGVDSEQDAFVLVMRRYVCSLHAWRERLTEAERRADTQTDAALHEVVLRKHTLLLLRVFEKVLEAALAVACQNIVHFDYKCENILLAEAAGDETADGSGSTHFWVPTESTPCFRVVVGDFGESKMFCSSDGSVTPQGWKEGQRDGAYTQRNRGTENIKSPEMLFLASRAHQLDGFDRRRKFGAGPPSDTWSLGCLLFELFTGRFLFSDERVFLVPHADQELVGAEEKAALCHDSEIIDLLLFMLERDPVRRPTIADALFRLRKTISRCMQRRKPSLVARSSPATSITPSLAAHHSTEHDTDVGDDEFVSSQAHMVWLDEEFAGRLGRSLYVDEGTCAGGSACGVVEIAPRVSVCFTGKEAASDASTLRELEVTHIVQCSSYPPAHPEDFLYLCFYNSTHLPAHPMRTHPSHSGHGITPNSPLPAAHASYESTPTPTNAIPEVQPGNGPAFIEAPLQTSTGGGAPLLSSETSPAVVEVDSSAHVSYPAPVASRLASTGTSGSGKNMESAPPVPSGANSQAPPSSPIVITTATHTVRTPATANTQSRAYLPPQGDTQDHLAGETGAPGAGSHSVTSSPLVRRSLLDCSDGAGLDTDDAMSLGGSSLGDSGIRGECGPGSIEDNPTSDNVLWQPYTSEGVLAACEFINMALLCNGKVLLLADPKSPGIAGLVLVSYLLTRCHVFCDTDPSTRALSADDSMPELGFKTGTEDPDRIPEARSAPPASGGSSSVQARNLESMRAGGASGAGSDAGVSLLEAYATVFERWPLLMFSPRQIRLLRTCYHNVLDLASCRRYQCLCGACTTSIIPDPSTLASECFDKASSHSHPLSVLPARIVCSCRAGDQSACPHVACWCVTEAVHATHGVTMDSLVWIYARKSRVRLPAPFCLEPHDPLLSVPRLLRSKISPEALNKWSLYQCTVCHVVTHAIESGAAAAETVAQGASARVMVLANHEVRPGRKVVWK
eukprot:Rmarinus@m.14128